MAVLPEYTWLIVYAAFGAFGFGWGTGSNDVANAFGTSVGSKTLTLSQAVLIAAIFEFTGALLLGRVNTETIASGIANPRAFQREPEIYAYGMCTTLLVGTVWQGLASFWGLNVSSTHSIIGGIIGFALVYQGAAGVKWVEKSDDAFPPYKGVAAIVTGWFIAPVIAAIASSCFFLTIRSLILRRNNAYSTAFWLLPFLVVVTVFISLFFVLTKGAKKTFTPDDNWSDSKSAWVAFVIAVCVAIVVAVAVLPILRKRVNRRFESDGTLKAGELPTSKVPDLKDPATEVRDPKTGEVVPAQPTKMSWARKAYKGATHGMTVDIHKVTEEDERVHALHEKAELFSPRVEFCFSYLQVFSAICVIFAHGAGEVGYMAGPLATVYEVVQSGRLPSKVKPPVWVILIGAVGLVVGLATYGYNVTRAMGVSMAKLSPSRGFCAELATAFILLLASQFGLPTSSSTTIVGAIVGVGLCEGTSGVNWKLFAKQFASWVMTMFVMGLGVAALFCQAVYSPSIVTGKLVVGYENQVSGLAANIYSNLNATYSEAPNSAAFANSTRLFNQEAGRARQMSIPSMVSTLTVDQTMSTLKGALRWAQNSTVYKVGQNNTQPQWVPTK